MHLSYTINMQYTSCHILRYTNICCKLTWGRPRTKLDIMYHHWLMPSGKSLIVRHIFKLPSVFNKKQVLVNSDMKLNYTIYLTHHGKEKHMCIKELVKGIIGVQWDICPLKRWVVMCSWTVIATFDAKPLPIQFCLITDTEPYGDIQMNTANMHVFAVKKYS